MSMDWDKLRIFHMVAEAGSFTHAGESLSLSQSVVSRHIGSLEESLGVTLFHRHARGLILTEQGETLHKASREIFARLAMVEGQLSDSKDHAEGSLSITIAEFFGHSLACPAGRRVSCLLSRYSPHGFGRRPGSKFGDAGCGRRDPSL
jgi:DNA-binding transcriptional LysR family regulator